jgi:hypothetical protein
MHVIYDPRHVLHDPATEVQYGVAMPMYEVPARPVTTCSRLAAAASSGRPRLAA